MSAPPVARHPGEPPLPRLGLRENLGQFSLLLLINAFVGVMVGMERTILPVLAEREFGIASRTAILAFLVSFGLVKALANLFAGAAADRFGRKRTLIAGSLAGLPVPFLIIHAPSWDWIVAANVLLGIQQGLCWSTAIVMKVDLVGPRRRGLAIGLNESTGYLALSAAAVASGYLAARHGLRPEPFYMGVVAAISGLALSLVVRDTRAHAAAEAIAHAHRDAPSAWAIFGRVSWRDRALRAVSQAGLVNNLNDGLSWGLLPLYFVASGASLGRAAMLLAIYPAVWGVGQILTGPLSDRLSRKWLMTAGMALQGAALIAIGASVSAPVWWAGMIGLGVGTALVYPTFLSSIAHLTQPGWRATAIGVFRMWRDLGYAAGALLAGGLADAFGISVSIEVIGAITLLSGVVVATTYDER
jgi:MFS family permease